MMTDMTELAVTGVGRRLEVNLLRRKGNLAFQATALAETHCEETSEVCFLSRDVCMNTLLAGTG